MHHAGIYGIYLIEMKSFSQEWLKSEFYYSHMDYLSRSDPEPDPGLVVIIPDRIRKKVWIRTDPDPQRCSCLNRY